MQTEHEAEEIMEESTIRSDKDEQDSPTSMRTTKESSTVIDEEDTTLIITAKSSSSPIIEDGQAHATKLSPTKFEKSNINLHHFLFLYHEKCSHLLNHR